MADDTSQVAGANAPLHTQAASGTLRPDKLITIRHHENYLREGGRRLFFCVLSLLGLAVLQLFIIFSWVITPPTSASFRGYVDDPVPAGQKVQTQDVTLFRPPKLDVPMHSISKVMNFANASAISVYSFNFFNYEKHLQSIQNYFTEAGWVGFLRAFQNSGIVDQVVKNHYIVSARTSAPPILLKKGIVDGRYFWQVQFPLYVSYRSSLVQLGQRMNVEMTVTRTEVSETRPEGIAVTNFVIRSVQKLF